MTGAVHPMALDVLKGRDISVNGYHSKNWDIFGLQSGKFFVNDARKPLIPLDLASWKCILRN